MLRYEKEGPIVVVTLDRPEVHNALSLDLIQGVSAAMADFQADPGLRVAILTGAGDKAFSAGGDLDDTIGEATSGGLSTIIPDDSKRFFSDVFKPIIAAVNGYCIAGGLELLQGTDLRVASTTATFGLGEVRWGLVPANGSHVRLPRQIPWAVAMEILLMGRTIEAERAREVGLVNWVVEPDDLMAKAFAVAEVLCSNGPFAVQAAKEIAVRAMGLESGFILEAPMARAVLTTNDAREGRAAFLEKRPPEFSGT